MIPRVAQVLPLLAATVLVAVSGGSPGAAAAVALALLATLPLAGRFELGPVPQLLATAAGAAAGLLLDRILPARDGAFHGVLASFAHAIALATLLATAVRLTLSEPRGSRLATQALGLASAVASGHASIGPLFPALATAQVLLVALALRAADRNRLPLRALGVRQLLALAGLLVVGGSCGAGLAGLLPFGYREAGGLIFSLDDETRATGFHDGPMQLGSMAGMEPSNEIVLRIFGEAPDPLLRGSVLVKYERGRWLPPPPLPSRAVRPAQAGAELVEVQLVAPKQKRLFVPLSTARLAVPTSAAVLADEHGLVRPEGDPPERFWFAPGAREELPVAGPGPEDLLVPDELGPELGRLAGAWTAGATSDRARMDALVRRLEAGYAYSQHFVRGAGRDPILEFLLAQRQGHCEYFATALALLGRASGVPARVVTGYRLIESSPLGGYGIVRERNAHAWVEAWLEGSGWTAFDPRPAVNLEEEPVARTPLAAALLDVATVWLRRGLDWVAARSAAELTIVGALLLAAFAALRLLRRRRAPAQAAEAPWTPVPPRAFVQPLLDALARDGLAWRRSEPLERLAARAETAGLPRGGEAAELLRRYAALAYGGVGDERALAADVARHVATAVPAQP